MSDPPLPSSRFALGAVLFEAATVVLAIALGWLFGAPPMRLVHWDLAGLAWGAAACLPILALAWWSMHSRIKILRDLTTVVEEMLLPLFRSWGWAELASLSLLAGLGEELLFRGIIQDWLRTWGGGAIGEPGALVASAVLFGLAHSINLAYALLAGLIGFYLGALWLWSGNLLAPITAHALYDFLMLVYLLHRVPSCPASSEGKNADRGPNRNPAGIGEISMQSVEELRTKKCVPCEGDVDRLSDDEVRSQLATLAGWRLSTDGLRIRKDWQMEDFAAAIEFFRQIAKVAEAEGHHPDLHLENYRHVSVELWTHAIQGLSENDFILAAKIDQLPVHQKHQRESSGQAAGGTK